MPVVDTHAHIAAVQFDGDRPAVLARAVGAGLTGILCVLSDLSRLDLFQALLENHDFLYGAAGIDPFSAGQLQTWQGRLESALMLPKVVAIGETGLDYYRQHTPPDVQQRAFRYQLSLSRRTGLPVIVHCRRAFEDTLRILGEFEAIAGIMHCFSGSVAQMQACLSRGLYISFAGVVTFPNAKGLREVCQAVPTERLLVETDCPYLAPQPVRGQRCEPVHIAHTLATIAELRGESAEVLGAAAARNACQLLRIG